MGRKKEEKQYMAKHCQQEARRSGVAAAANQELQVANLFTD
jgi:hypothetical protein